MAESSTPFRSRLFRYVPALGALRTYRARDARHDFVAGLTVATVAVPQAMAYALIAGLPPEYGLYTAIVMTAVGALFDSSRQLINGPTNAISIAMLSAIGALPDPQTKLQAAVLLAFLMGSIQIGISLLRLGDLTRYISSSVIVGVQDVDNGLVARAQDVAGCLEAQQPRPLLATVGNEALGGDLPVMR